MKTSPWIKVVTLFAGMVIILAAQWRIGSRIREEDRELQGLREQAEQTRTELERATETSMQRDSEAKSLREEVIKLRDELGMVRQELKEAKSDAAKVATASLGSVHRTSTGGPSPTSGVPVRTPSEERTVFHIRPVVRTNLAASPSDFFPAYKSAGRVDDVELWNGIPRETVSAGPDWWPSLPLPLNFTDGEAIARRELGRLVNDEAGWEVREVHLYRLNRSSTKWHYSFRFEPTDRRLNDWFTVHVNMAGTPGTTGLRVGD
ncbi:MAG: hypothetical protein JNL10_14675 [Verrucomicrobiales bacterium]|nr:hypothetical protein [Verrucomicrobiales bacterium]